MVLRIMAKFTFKDLSGGSTVKRGWNLDEKLFQRVPASHHGNIDEFTKLVGERLAQNPYRDCEALDCFDKVWR
jgi:hypothetical protein